MVLTMRTPPTLTVVTSKVTKLATEEVLGVESVKSELLAVASPGVLEDSVLGYHMPNSFV